MLGYVLNHGAGLKGGKKKITRVRCVSTDILCLIS